MTEAGHETPTRVRLDPLEPAGEESWGLIRQLGTMRRRKARALLEHEDITVALAAAGRLADLVREDGGSSPLDFSGMSDTEADDLGDRVLGFAGERGEMWNPELDAYLSITERQHLRHADFFAASKTPLEAWLKAASQEEILELYRRMRSIIYRGILIAEVERPSDAMVRASLDRERCHDWVVSTGITRRQVWDILAPWIREHAAQGCHNARRTMTAAIATQAPTGATIRDLLRWAEDTPGQGDTIKCLLIHTQMGEDEIRSAARVIERESIHPDPLTRQDALPEDLAIALLRRPVSQISMLRIAKNPRLLSSAAVRDEILEFVQPTVLITTACEHVPQPHRRAMIEAFQTRFPQRAEAFIDRAMRAEDRRIIDHLPMSALRRLLESPREEDRLWAFRKLHRVREETPTAGISRSQ
jgi:hypothetical protein